MRRNIQIVDFLDEDTDSTTIDRPIESNNDLFTEIPTLTRSYRRSDTTPAHHSSVVTPSRTNTFVFGRNKPAESVCNALLRAQQGDKEILYNFRTLSSKQELLSEALKIPNKDILLITILTLCSSLSYTIFAQTIDKYPTAVDCYVAYLTRIGRRQELIRLYDNLKRPYDSARERLCSVFEITNDQERLGAMKSTIPIFERNEILSSSIWLKFLKEAASLLERQISIEKHDARISQDEEIRFRERIWVQCPRSSIVGSSLSSTLEYCHIYHPQAPLGKLSCPLSIKKEYQVSDTMNSLCTIRARSRLKDWNSLKALIPSNSLIRSLTIIGNRRKLPVSACLFVEYAVKHGAPEDIIRHFISFCSEANDIYDSPFETALNFGIYSLAIDLAGKNIELLKKVNDKLPSSESNLKMRVAENIERLK